MTENRDHAPANLTQPDHGMRSPSRRDVLRVVTTAGIALPLWLAGCAEEREPDGIDRSITDEIVATSFPAEFIARSIAGTAMPVHGVVPAGLPPEQFRPSPDEIRRMQRARLIVTGGAGLEPWSRAVSLPRSRVVNLARGLEDRLLTIETGVTHSHGIAGEHTHRGPDGHTWLDPDLLIEQGRTMHAAAVRALPEQRSALDEALSVFVARAGELSWLVDAIRPLAADRLIVADAPSYNYLARKLEVPIETVEGEPPAGAILLRDGPLEGASEAARSVAFPVFAAAPENRDLDLIDLVRDGLDRLRAALVASPE